MPLTPIRQVETICHWTVTCKGRVLGTVFARNRTEARRLALEQYGDPGTNYSTTGIGDNDDFEVEEY